MTGERGREREVRGVREGREGSDGRGSSRREEEVMA